MSLEFERSAAILVGICSSHVHPERRQACRETWLKHPADGVTCLFFVGTNPSQDDSKPSNIETDTLELVTPDTYHELPQKVLDFFKWALANSDFDWLFKCDDDTYLDLKRLKGLPVDNIDLIGDESLEQRGAPSGGAGYLLSRRAVEALCADQHLQSTGPEDLIIGHAITGYGMSTHATPRLCLHSERPPLKDNDMISAHWCGPKRMKAIFSIRYDKNFREIKVTHPCWKDTLILFPNGAFMRKTSSCSGQWRENGEGQIHLDWSDWDAELLLPSDSTSSLLKQSEYFCVPVPAQS